MPFDVFMYKAYAKCTKGLHSYSRDLLQFSYFLFFEYPMFLQSQAPWRHSTLHIFKLSEKSPFAIYLKSVCWPHPNRTNMAEHTKAHSFELYLVFSFSVSSYNSFCEEDHQCVPNNTRCDVPKCACKEGYKWDSSKCVNSEGRCFLTKRSEKYCSPAQSYGQMSRVNGKGIWTVIWH
jgi:hypothetical protein